MRKIVFLLSALLASLTTASIVVMVPLYGMHRPAGRRGSKVYYPSTGSTFSHDVEANSYAYYAHDSMDTSIAFSHSSHTCYVPASVDQVIDVPISYVRREKVHEDHHTTKKRKKSSLQTKKQATNKPKSYTSVHAVSMILAKWIRESEDVKVGMITQDNYNVNYHLIMPYVLPFIESQHFQKKYSRKSFNKTGIPLSVTNESSPELIRHRTLDKMLILGEADFSYTVAFMQKRLRNRDNFPFKSMIATELRNKKELQRLYQKFNGNIKQLRKRGVKTLFTINATKIHKSFKGQRITKIYFNCPHVHGANPKSGLIFIKIIQQFFQSAKQLQRCNDRIYLTIPVLKNAHSIEAQALEGIGYGLYEASYDAGYKYVNKRNFGPKRYPGYQHRQTKRDKSAKIARKLRQYIFEKKSDKSTIRYTRDDDRFLYKEQHSNKHYCGFYVLPYYDTDYDSSDYE